MWRTSEQRDGRVTNVFVEFDESEGLRWFGASLHVRCVAGLKDERLLAQRIAHVLNDELDRVTGHIKLP